MANLALRGVSRLLPRIGVRTIYSRANQVIPQHLMRMVEIRARGQQQVRSFVLSSSRYMQAQVDEEETEAEASSEDNKLDNKSPEQQLLDTKLYKMDMELRKCMRVSPLELDGAIQVMSRCNTVTNTQALLVIRFCGRACTDDNKQTRRKRMDELLPLLKSKTTLDVSHFNAILKVHMDNDVKVDISKFLTEMDSAGLIPNRVTYNYLIGLYCLEGNITGATTVLEQMKDEGMTINESVFHSLLYGHVYNKDKASTKETLQIMESSGLLPGAETYTMMLLAAARVKDGDRVEELLQETVEQEIKLDAGDHFRLLVALTENGMAAEAENLVDKVPRRTGYFQELRNTIPQMIFAGHPDLAILILDDFQDNNKNVTPDDRQNKSKGAFLSSVLAKSDVEAEKSADIVLKMLANGQEMQMMAYITECINQKKEQHLEVLKEKLDSRENPTKLYSGDAVPFIMRQGRKSLADAGYALRKLTSMGLFVEHRKVVRTLIHQVYGSHLMQPAEAVSKILTEIDIKQYVVDDQMVCYLLDKHDAQSTQALNGFFIFARTHIRTSDVAFFKDRLLDNALVVDSTDLIINILFLARNFQDGDQFYDEKLYTSVLGEMKLNARSLEVLKTLLVEINKHKLGVPRKVADEISKDLDNVEIKELLDQAVTDFDQTPDIWTKDARMNFWEKRKKVHRNACNDSGYSVGRSQGENQYKWGVFDIPQDLDKMYNIKNIISKRGEVNYKLTTQIVRNLTENDKPEEAVKELEEVKQKDEMFSIKAFTINDVAVAFLRKNQPQEALDFLNKYASAFYLSTYVEICEGFAKQGDHEKVIELLHNLKELPEGKELLNRESRNYLPLMREYESKGDVENMENAFEVIEEIYKGRGINILLGSLVSVHLKSDNAQGALEAFEKIIRKYKSLPAQYELMTRLVQDENITALQKVIDMSISVFGEEMTLYTLTQVFLEQDRRSQAKKMLETPGLMYNQKEINRIILSFTNKKRLDCLEDFVIMSKNVFGCDRDHLFISWVNAEENNPDKIEEIWMQIQDEGHAPSVNLKSEIAKALKSADRTIPFPTADLNLEDKPALSNSYTSPIMDRAKSDAPKAATKPRKERKAASEPQEDVPLSDSELQDLVKSLKVETSRNRQADGVIILMRNDKLTEAAEIILQKELFTRKIAGRLIQQYAKKQQFKELDSFIAGLSEDNQKSLRVDLLTKEFNTVRLMEIVKASDGNNIGRKFKTNEVGAVFEKSPEIKEELETLSNTGHLAATIMLARVAIFKRDTEALVRCWNLDTREDKSIVAYDIVEDTTDIEHLKWLTETLNSNTEILRKATNKCLANTKKDKTLSKEILDYSLQQGQSLDKVNTKSLKMFLENDQYPNHAEEIKRILMEREEKA